MLNKVTFQDLGSVNYKRAWEYQQKLFNRVLSEKSDRSAESADHQTGVGYLLFCEHPHVYTLGKSGSENNLLIDPGFLKRINAEFYKIDRGGDITYHGPGQIVGYPIINLEKLNIGIRDYIYNLEESIIRTLNHYKIESSRLKSASGVWIDSSMPGKARKICAIGVRASRHITMHGFAFNVNTRLEYFSHINPCGFTDKGVTSMEKEMAKKQEVEQIKATLKTNLSEVFGFELETKTVKL